MTSPHRGTARPFTVIVCAGCSADRELSIIDQLRTAIRRCPHAMLVAAKCVLGPLTCASRPTGGGVMALVQPCTKDRAACGPSHWVGPITDEDEAAALRDWLELGQWENTPVPRQLARHQRWVRGAGRNN
ncbi:hypothetical protein A9X04_28120 [Mycobacterium sp. E3247]|nr:hypothetical protein A9X04_28120 [Mycobacterium sp. E3247]